MSAFVRRTLRVVLSASLLACPITPAAAQSIEVLHAFAAKPSRPFGTLLELVDGVFLGTSSAGGAYQQGTIYLLFRRADSTWDQIVVHSFSGHDGATPMTGLIRATDGNFYGTTQHGGANLRGTVFRMTPFGEVTTFHTFSGPDGEHPEHALVQAPDGRLWGTTSGGGQSQYGTVFRISIGGAFTVMRSFFDDAHGLHPQSLVVGN